MAVSQTYALGFNGVDLYSDCQIIVERGTTEIAPEINAPSVGIPYMPGTYGFDAYAGARKWQFSCFIYGDSISAIQTMLTNAMRTLNEPSAKVLEIGTFTDRYWLAQFTGASNLEWIGSKAARFNLNFVSTDPHAYSNSLTSLSFTQNSGPDSHTITALEAAGSAWAEPIITLDPDTSPSSVIIANAATGESTTYGTTFTEGATNRLRCHSGLFLWQTSTDSGANWTTAMTGVSGTFPRIKPGVENIITITGFAAGGVAVEFRARYL